MNQILVWKDIDKLNVTFESESSIPDDFVKLSCSKENVFLLAKDNSVWYGKVDSDMNLVLKQTEILAVDIACYNIHFYYTVESGRVFKALIDNLELKDEVVLHEDAKSCIHGYITASQHISVKHIEAGGTGILYLSESGQLWASGNHPELDIHNEDEPKKVSFFEGRHVISLACGLDFNCIVVHKRDDHCPLVNGDFINDDSEVFVSTCPQCANENIISPLSPQSDCPLGGQKHSNESISISTSTSKNIDSEDKKSDNGNSSSSTEGDSDRRTKNDTILVKNLDNDTDSETAEEEKGDRMSRLLMNTEAARQFFTRQLSWMSSGGEELLAEVSGPTKIIKKNMTTMASLVYEGVKTVGDKVATLSRHVSGGSDNNSDSFEEFVTDELNPSSTSSVRCEWSCSAAFSDVSDRGGEEKLILYLNRGSRLIKTEVWTWGNIKHGQLGTGDTVSRNKPVVVHQLVHVGTMRVECGWSHCAAVTLTGRCAVWGRNDMGQVCEDTKGIDQSSPIVWGRTSQAVTGSRHTLLLAPDNTLHWLGKHRPETLNSSNTELDISEYIENEKSVPLRVLSSCDFSACLLGVTCTEMTSNSDLANEQCFLEEMINVHTSVVKPLSRKSCLEDYVSNLCSRYTDLIHFTAFNVATLYQGIPSCVLLKSHTDEHLLVYERYLIAVCDVTAMSGFAQIARIVDIPQKLIACFSDRLPSRKTSPEDVLTFAFVYPLSRISFYKMMLGRGSNEVSSEFQRWESFCEAQENARKLAEGTRIFWENAGRLVETLRIRQRRLLRDSKAHPLTIHNASRFSNHWFILLSDSFVHITGNNKNVHALETLWIETLQDTDTLQNALLVTTPEDTLTLVAPSAFDKMEWLHAFQNAIKTRLNKNPVPTTRIASYTFTKLASFKDAKYTGRWVSGKLEGKGRLEWPDKKFYIGHFHCSMLHGFGRLETPGDNVYEGYFKDGLQNGYGYTKYQSGDLYEGYFKDGLPCGHGMCRVGQFTSNNNAFTYFGEWVAGVKQGYGVLDDIITGEKYMGLWNNNLKTGNGVIITRNEIYYEGIFSQNEINGQALMIFEDGSYYEGEMKTAGVFNGKGTLVFASGDKVEGNMYGPWNEGIKITTGTLVKLPSSVQPVTSPEKEKPKIVGKLSTPASQKWKAIFHQCWVSLGASPDGRVSDRDKQRESQKAWENIAAALNSQHASSHRHNEKLLKIPDFGRETLESLTCLENICTYIRQAFESSYHPLGIALSALAEAYRYSYGVICDHSYLLLPHAVEEIHSITERLYQVIRLLFPALPKQDDVIILGEEPGIVVNMVSIMHPQILPRMCSELFDLYSLDNKQENDAFQERLLELNQHPDSTLMQFLDIDRNLWMNDNGEFRNEQLFTSAIQTFQMLKTTFVPSEKFEILKRTFKAMEDEVQNILGENYQCTTDVIIPLLEFIIIRSQILHLASEVRFLTDFKEERFKHSVYDFYLTNLNACYKHILQEKRTTIVR